jgi:hypothetical protein
LVPEVEIYLQLSMQEKLARAIEEVMNSKSGTTKAVTSIVKKELAIFEVEGVQLANLESC